MKRSYFECPQCRKRLRKVDQSTNYKKNLFFCPTCWKLFVWDIGTNCLKEIFDQNLDKIIDWNKLRNEE